MDATVPIVIVGMSVLLMGAVLTGKGEELCTAMGGHYRPVPPPEDQCPDGKWRNLLQPHARPTK